MASVAVAQEIVGALTPVQGWLSMLATGALDGDPDARREVIALVKEAARRVERLSGDFLDLSALETSPK